MRRQLDIIWVTLYRIAMTVLLICLMGGVAFAFREPVLRYRTLRQRNAGLIKEVRDAGQELQRLMYRIDRLKRDPEELAREARMRGLVGEGEVLYLFEPTEEAQ